MSAPRPELNAALSLTLSNAAVDLGQASQWLLERCATAALSPEDSYRMDLVLAEALGNISAYAYQAGDDRVVELSWQRNGGGVMLGLADRGQPFDPFRREPAPVAADLEASEPGGLGITLMRRYSDAVNYQRDGDRNRLSLYFSLETPIPASDAGTAADADENSAEARVIGGCALFRGLDQSAVKAMLAHCPVRHLQAGETLLAAGQVNHHLFIVLQGKMAVQADASGQRPMIAVPAGECIGELSIIDGMPTSTAVVALTDAQCMVVSDELFWERLTQMPRLARNMLRVLTERVRRQNRTALDAMEQQLRFEQFDRELALAVDLQASMLPLDFERFAEDLRHADVHALMEPAHDVGGDFYDIFMLGNDRICVAVGDVSGKGMPAALFMVRSMTLLRTQVRKKRSLSKSMAEINRLLCENNPTNMFVTLVVAVISVNRRELRWVNGGHCAPFLLRRKGGLEALEAPRGILLGVDDSVTFDEGQCRFRAGDSLFLYTDGVTEAQNAAGELFGEQGLQQVLDAADGDSAEQLIRRVRASIQRYAAEADVSDDITMLALHHQRK